MDKTSTPSISSKLSVSGARIMPSRHALNFVRQFARAYSVQARIGFIAN
ncbi:MAG: hypothetical protein K2N28_03405 [Muribaculaceae bacterium]|nr:hypothetical protein [Muribaculaceae bacterium]